MLQHPAHFLPAILQRTPVSFRDIYKEFTSLPILSDLNSRPFVMQRGTTARLYFA